MTTHVNDMYMTVSKAHGVLSLVWKAETESFTDDIFKTEALKLVEVVKNTKSKKILVDMRNFHYQLSADVIEWRNKNVIATYNDIGVEKFAFISQKPAIKQDKPENTFVTQTFTSEDAALAWLID